MTTTSTPPAAAEAPKNADTEAAAALGLTVLPRGGVIGAEIRGLDLASAGRAEADVLSRLVAEFGVLFFAGLGPTVAQLGAFAGHMGELEVHPYLDSLDDDHPSVVVLNTSTTPKADLWHTDVTFSQNPPIGAFLHMVECPPFGGDTMWSSLPAVYDSLSPALAGFLETLTCIHDDGGQGNARAEHPVVRIHPITGRKALYVNKQFSRRIPQLSRPESQALLSFLFHWQAQVKFTCRWHWTPGDVAFWDNRATLHTMVDDTETARILHRVTIVGDEPSGVAGIASAPARPSKRTASSDFYGIGGYDF